MPTTTINSVRLAYSHHAGRSEPPFFAIILDKIAAAARRARRYTFHGAGHVPQLTHPDEYVRVVTDFVQHATAGPSA